MTDLRVLVAGAWDEGDGYPRATGLLQGLRRAGAEAFPLRHPLPALGRGKVALAAAPWAWPHHAFATWRHLRTFTRELSMAITAHRPHVVLVPYPGHLLVRQVRRTWRSPLVLDLFLLAHDTVVEDRRLLRPGSLPARLLARLDRRACAAADLVLLDTAAHAAHAAAVTGLPAERFSFVPVCDPDAPETGAIAYRPPAAGEPLDVLFFGTGVPLHGLDVLLAAVQRMPRVRLTLAGGTAADRELAVHALGERLRLLPEFVPAPQLRALLRRSHLVAGVFGASAKADRVVPFKVVHGLAAARPVLTGDAAAVRAMLRPGDDVLVCPRGDAGALAAALESAATAPERLAVVAANGRAAYDRTFSVAATGSRLVEVLRAAVDGSRRAQPAQSVRVEVPAVGTAAGGDAPPDVERAPSLLVEDGSRSRDGADVASAAGSPPRRSRG